MRRFVDGRFEKAGKAGRFGTGGSASRTGRHVGQVGGRAERAFVRCLSFANSSLIVRLTFGERLCDLEVSEERKERFRKERKFTKEMKLYFLVKKFSHFKKQLYICTLNFLSSNFIFSTKP